VPGREGDEAVTDNADEGARLRDAFHDLAEAAPLEGVDWDRIWRAVASELSAEERGEVVERTGQDPSWALAWRLAHELWLASRGSAAPRWAWSRSGYGALAAGLLLAISLGLWLWRRPVEPGYRAEGSQRIESLVPEGRRLSRNRCLLRWKGPPGATYELRVTSEDRRHVHSVSWLDQAEYRVPEEFLSQLPADAKLWWQVEARLRDGTILSRGTFSAVGC
jgi:hypothetical protein